MKRFISKLFMKLLLIFFINFSIQAKPTLTIYACNLFSSNLGPKDLIKSEFERKYDCNLNFFSFWNENTLLNILKKNKRKFSADIILGINDNRIGSLQIRDLFLEYRIKNLKFKFPLKEYNKFLIPYNYGYLAFIYNNKKILKVPDSFEELISEKSSWKIIYQDPRTSSSGLGMLFWIKKIYEKNSSEIWRKIARKTVTVTKSWGESYELFLKGEGDFFLSYSSSPGFFLLKKNNYDYSSIIFKEGHYLQTELIGISIRSQNVELSKKFVDFILSPKIQRKLSIYNWMYPSIRIKLPKVYDFVPEPKKFLQFDIQETNQNYQKWIQEWLHAVIQ
ncbi:hypothetical protein AOE55_01625 [Candidatus Riesia pediculicola]|nr:hypothetical protein AOE55_01625 [Candidatus Riesia pediculicola]